MSDTPVYKKMTRKADKHLEGKVIAKHGKQNNQKLKPYCICQGKVDAKKHHSFRSPVRSCTELGFYSPERTQVARSYSNEHTRQEV